MSARKEKHTTEDKTTHTEKTRERERGTILDASRIIVSNCAVDVVVVVFAASTAIAAAATTTTTTTRIRFFCVSVWRKGTWILFFDRSRLPRWFHYSDPVKIGSPREVT